MFRRASLLYVPASDPKKLTKALGLPKVDCRVMDLEDSVSLNQKDAARLNVSNILGTISKRNPKQETSVRINSFASGLAERDLAAILQHARSLDSILLPKVEQTSHMTLVREALRDANAHHVKLLASIESAKGLLNLSRIIEAGLTAYPNQAGQLEAIVFAAEDYAANLGLVRTPSRTEMLLGRQLVVAHAVANGLQAIDLVCVDLKNPDILRDECREGRTFGFTGKQAIHPNQIDIIQSSFTSSAEELAYAQKILDANEAHKAKGVGAFDLDGKVIDAVEYWIFFKTFFIQASASDF